MSDAFNYVAVLVSIVVGLGVTRVMSGLSEVMQSANRRNTYWVHALWLFSLFCLLMLNWWLLYRWRNAPSWNFFLFVWVTIPGILMYLATAILFPGELETTGSPTWRDYYYKNRRGFFFVLGSIAPLDVVDTLLKGRAHFFAQSPFYVPFVASWAIGSLIAGITRNERYHAFWAILFPLSMLLFTFVNMLTLG